MHGCLRHEAVWKRKTDDTADEACAAEKEEVPVEAGGFLKRILSSLRCEGRDVLVEC